MELVVGYHPVREALRARRRRLHGLRIREALRHSGVDELRTLAAEAGVSVRECPARELDADVPEGLRAQGFVLEAGPLPAPDLLELLEGPGARRLVVLDGVEDPRNLGAVARVAEASGAQGLVQALRRAPPVGAVASRASAGALEHLPVARVPNLARALRTLRDADVWLLGADAGADVDLFEAPDRLFEGHLAVVLGAEGRGLRPGVARLLDHRVRIPMAGCVGSLNVSTAAAVVLFEILRRTRPRASVPAG
ncbi:MAG: RNA methyltransferase [Myxococcota bacterium]|nr:RNA methyltransferase [Myxococcota bacterium]